MNVPFPGMDPYLEHPVLWESVHARLIPALANQLQPRLDPRYVASIEERIFVEGPQRRIPDVWIQKTADDGGGVEEDKKLHEFAVLSVARRGVELVKLFGDPRGSRVIGLAQPDERQLIGAQQVKSQRLVKLLVIEIGKVPQNLALDVPRCGSRQRNQGENSRLRITHAVW